MDRAKFNQLVMDALGKGAGATRDFAVATDDVIQGAVRDHILRLPQEGRLPKDAPLSAAREFLGHTVHQARHGYGSENYAYKAGDFPGDKEAVLASRALQALGLTGAGYGLAQLTHQFQNEFGGPADSQPMNTGGYLL